MTDEQTIGCAQAMDLMSAGLDGELRPEQAEALQAHLDVCPDCKRLWDAMRGLDQKLSELREPAPEGLKRGVLYRIDQATGKAKKPGHRWFGPGTAIGAVAAVLILLVGIGVIPLGGRAQQAAPAEKGVTGVLAQPQLPDSEMRAEAPLTENALSGGQIMEPWEPNLQADGLQTPAGEYSSATDHFLYNAAPDDPESVPDKAKAREEEERSLCASLSENEDALVLLYTEFTPDSLFSLLERQEPALYALIAELKPVEGPELLIYKADCKTVLAIHEWLLANAPEIEDSKTVKQATAAREQLEALDPQSGSLFRVITWDAAAAPVSWPESWEKDWPLRLRNAENWTLFYPSEDYVASPAAQAWLVFSLPEK